MACPPKHRYQVSVAQRTLGDLLIDLGILCGDKPLPDDVPIGAVLGTAIVNAQVLLWQLQSAQDQMKDGKAIAFPKPPKETT